MDERTRRVVLNEAVFRQANEALSGLQGSEFPLELLCECGRIDCVQRIEMNRSEYEQLRADPTLFAVVRGHDVHDVEDVVELRDAYDIVQKRQEAHELARETDPRSN